MSDRSPIAGNRCHVHPSRNVIARYARFRQGAGVIFALSLLAVLWGLLGIVLEIAGIVRGETAVIGGLGRVVAWAFAATAGYGILKALGEALLLWADVAELCNTSIETLWQERRE